MTETMPERDRERDRPIRIGLIGAGFMARTHSLGYRNAVSLLGPEAPPIEFSRVADVNASLAEGVAKNFGWAEATGDAMDVVSADDIDLVDIVTPNSTHAELAVAAAESGKHVLCEKPLADRVEAARTMHRAVDQAGVVNQVGFVFRKWPAMGLARQLVEAGELGQILHFRGHYFHDYALDPALDMGWRVRRETAGAGSIGDLGSHLIDLARYLVGDVSRVHARTRVIWPRRPMLGSDSSVVDVDDAADVLLEFESGATGILQTNWMAAGYKTDIAFEALGDKGALRFTWRRNGELQFYSHKDPARLQGFRTIHVGPEHPGAERFWPVAGQGLGYGDAFTILIGDLLRSIRNQEAAAPSFLDGLRAAEFVDAAQRSAKEQSWVAVTDHHG